MAMRARRRRPAVALAVAVGLGHFRTCAFFLSFLIHDSVVGGSRAGGQHMRGRAFIGLSVAFRLYAALDGRRENFFEIPPKKKEQAK